MRKADAGEFEDARSLCGGRPGTSSGCGRPTRRRRPNSSSRPSSGRLDAEGEHAVVHRLAPVVRCTTTSPNPPPSKAVNVR
jgi:hypothetical protein